MYNQSRVNHYSEECFHGEDIDRIIKAAKIKLSSLDYDTFVSCGLSGNLMAPHIAKALKKNICVIRKEKEQCHDFSLIVGYKPKKYVIVDDFISLGGTVKYILNILDNILPRPECIAIFLYSPLYPVKEYQDRLGTILTVPIIIVPRIQ